MTSVSVLQCFKDLINGYLSLIDSIPTNFVLTWNLTICQCAIFKTTMVTQYRMILGNNMGHETLINCILTNFHEFTNLFILMYGRDNGYQSNIIITQLWYKMYPIKVMIFTNFYNVKWQTKYKNYKMINGVFNNMIYSFDCYKMIIDICLICYSTYDGNINNSNNNNRELNIMCIYMSNDIFRQRLLTSLSIMGRDVNNINIDLQNNFYFASLQQIAIVVQYVLWSKC